MLGNFGYPAFPGSSSLITPVLTTEMAEQHFAEGKTPIVIYPDSVKGRPLESGLTVIYLLNYLGLLGGEDKFSDDALYFSYSKKIADTSPSPGNILFMPISDPNVFYPPPVPAQRRGKCFWAAKYRHFHNQSVGPEVDGATEITRDRPDSHTKAELRELFQTSELFYCYENSALAIEAALCGCPVVFVPNPYFKEVIADHELGQSGLAWGFDPLEIQRAVSDVHKFRDRYIESLSKLEIQLKDFVSITQARADEVPYNKIINLEKTLLVFGYESLFPLRWLFLLQRWNRVAESQGKKAAFRKSVKYLLIRSGVWKFLGPVLNLFRTVRDWIKTKLRGASA